MSSAGSVACPNCSFRWNAPGAAVCQVCNRPLPMSAAAADGPMPAAASSDVPPASAPPYPPSPARKAVTPPPAAPAAPVAPEISPIFGGEISGDVVHLDQMVGRPPVDPARWLTLAAVVIGLVPLVTAGVVPLVDGAGGLAALSILVAVLLALSGGRRRRMLRITMDAPARGQITALMVDPTGRPAVGSVVELRGRFLANRQFYAEGLRVATGDAASSPLADSGVLYAGRKRASLWVPPLLLVFALAFWTILYFELSHLPL